MSATTTRRAGRSLTNVALVALALAAIIWMDRHRPNLDANQAPFSERGQIGAAVRARDFALLVERVTLTRALEVPGTLASAPPQRRDTDGVWLLVHAQLDALREPMSLPASMGAPSLRARDGTVYAHAGGRLPMGFPLLTSATAVPGRPARGVLVFELPAAQLPDVVLLASRNMINQLDSELEIDLGLTEAEVERQLASLTPSIVLQRQRP
jgi:hypothetical protein